MLESFFKSPETHMQCALTSLFAVGAVMSVTVAIMSLIIERLWLVLPGSPYFDSIQSLFTTTMIMLFGGTIAFFMVWTEFTVIAETSALTFMVAGTFKEIVTGLILYWTELVWS